jgi:nucleotide-binding universal stress UspA family protein
MLPTRILVATDASRSAAEAEAFAAELAFAEHASSVVVVTVLDEYPARGSVVSPSAAAAEPAEELVRQAAEHVRGVIGIEAITIEDRCSSRLR